MKGERSKIKSMMVVMTMLLAAFTAIVVLTPNIIVSADAPNAFSITLPVYVDYGGGAIAIEPVSGIVRITWENEAADYYHIIVDNTTVGNTTDTYYDWDTTSHAKGAHQVLVRAGNGTAEYTWGTPENMTVNVLGTPGINGWQCGRTTLGWNPFASLDTSNIKVGSTLTALNADSTAWASQSGYFYLWYPVYSGNDVNQTYNLTWSMYEGTGTGTFPPRIEGGNNYVFGDSSERDIYFGIAGLWLIGPQSSFTPDGTNASRLNATVPAWFWVNTTDTFTSVPTDTSFYYGSAGTVGITVEEDGVATTNAFVAVYDNSNPGRLVGTSGQSWAWQENEQPPATIGKNSSMFTNAGTWTIASYWDDDKLTSDGASIGSRVNYYEGNAYYRYYNKSLYGSTYGAATHIENTATWYNFSTCGPWDPPERNDTTKSITVNTGKPTISLVNSTEVYWGFIWRLEINVTDADGIGVTGANVTLRKSGNTSHIWNRTYGDLWINETSDGNYTVEIARYADSTSSWANMANGSWYVYIAKDVNSDGTEEWNNSVRISVRSTTPPVRLTIIDDGDPDTGTTTDKKVNVPAFTPTNTVGIVTIQFQILGTDVGDNQGRAYYGDDTHEDRHNISITGDILYPMTDSTLTKVSGAATGIWQVVLTPTKAGGSITITINWPGSNNGTDTETINIINGSIVTTNIDSFTYGNTLDITVTVKNQNNLFQDAGDVHIVWRGGARWNYTAPGTGAPGKGEGGEYTFKMLPGDQGTSAPHNLTIAGKTPGSNQWGYATIHMSKNHNIVVNVTPSVANAGDIVKYDIDILVNGAAPASYDDITLDLIDSNGGAASGDDQNSFPVTGSYNIDDKEMTLSGGTWTLYAHNATHDSEGNNGTLIITPYMITTTPSILAWLIDTNTNISIQVTPSSNGTLQLDNVSTTPNGSYVGVSPETIDIMDGQGTLTGFNSTDLGNITFDYTPDGGESREGSGILKITTATATPIPATVYIGEVTTVEVTVTHPATGAALEGVRVDLDLGVNLSDSKLDKLPDYKNTDADGKARFAITAAASGNVTIFIQQGTDPENPFVIRAAARKTMTITTDPSVEEGGTFTVSAKDANGNLITDATVSILFNGVTTTTTTGTVELTAPAVPESLDYRIEGTAEGYSTDDTTIKIINKPKIYISAPTSGTAGTAFTVKAGGDDGNAYGITITVTDASGTTVTTATTAGPDGVSITIGSQGTYTIIASKDNYEDSDPVTISVGGGGIPGFELLTLIVALGVAFILLRRRRR